MLPDRISVKYELFGAWCAPIFSVLTAIGFLGFAHFYDPASAGLTADELNAFYAERDFEVILGMSLFCFATLFLAIYSVQLALWLWRNYEHRSPLMALSQMLGGVGVVLLVFISCCLWIGAAYRSDVVGESEISVALNDAAWFGFLIGWVMLALQMAATAAITWHDRESRYIPRWLTWFSIIGLVPLAFANGCAFTETGPFAWDGALGYYLPMAVWGFWLDGHAFFMRREIMSRLRAPETTTVDTPPVIAPEIRTPASV